MKKAIILFVLFFFSIHPWSLFSFHERWFSPRGFEVELRCRSFQPGEIIILSIQDNPAIRNAQVQFLGKKYRFVKNPKASCIWSLIGLDLGLKPAKYPMKIYIQGSDGEWNVLEKFIILSSREFPEKRLWVKEEYVTPPSTVLERIRRESELLRTIYQRFTQEWLGEGPFIMPADGHVFDNFGERRIYNNKPRSSHGGVDISCPTGTPVRASNSGKIALASDLYFSGKTVIIDHGLGLFSLYCHFSKIKVKRDQVVRKGAIIGEIGATGRVTGPHLHWGVKIFGNRVDPFSLLSLRFD